MKRWLSRNVIEFAPDGTEIRRGLSVVTVRDTGEIAVQPFTAESEAIEFTNRVIRITPPSKIEFL